MSQLFDIPVALIFFNRADTFEKVFKEVKKIKPQKLFLIQDGPREGNEKDIEGIEKCRKIAEDIDWECEVFKNYSDVNLGCGRRPSSGISWVLENVDKTIILEDDCVPCETFFTYCKEMLERYENDERISYISGLNHFGEWDTGDNSYLFAKTGAIWGWATWKRAWDKYDYNVNLINDEYLKKTIAGQISDKYVAGEKVNAWMDVNKKVEKNEKLSYWDIQWGLVKYSQNQLVIVPKYNQIQNIGIGETSTHAQKTKKAQFKKNRSYFFIPTKKLELPLVHPQYCFADTKYDDMVYKNLNRHKYLRKIKGILK